MPDDFEQMWGDLAPVGRSARQRRLLPPAVHARRARAARVVRRAVRGARAATSRPTASATLVAWWGHRRRRPGRRVLTGSHLDSVLDGGAYDGPLGVVSALAAVDLLRERGVAPARPIGVSVFVEEEGSRFGLACLGSRLATGAITLGRGARELRDRDGVRPARRDVVAGLEPASAGAAGRAVGTLRRAARRAGPRPRRPRRGGRGGQRDLAARALPLRLHRRGQPRRHHPDGGPARPDADLRDDRARRQQAGPAGRPARDLRPGRRSTPNGTNAVPSRVTAWLDARCSSDAALADAGRRDRAAGAPSAPTATAPR